MKKLFKSKIVLSALIGIALCISLIAGATFAIFTSEASVNVSVSSATVKVTATVKDEQLYSYENIDINALTGEKVTRTMSDGFLAGGTATNSGGTFTLTNMVPGDGISFKVAVANLSNVDVKYRLEISEASGSNLMKALKVTVDEKEYAGAVNGKWQFVKAYGEINPVSVWIELPLSANNDWQNKKVSFDVRIVAVQGNVDTTSTWDGTTIDTLWYNDEQTSFDIDTAEALAGMAALASEGETFEGKTISLTENVNLNDKKWTPIPSFKGEFNGNGNTVYGLKLDSTEGDKPRAGLFNGVEAGSKIHDLKIDGVDATVGKNGRVGVLGNYISGEVENIEIKNVKATSTDPTAWVGGLCAFMSWPAIKNCTVENMEVNAPDGAAFIAGFAPIMQKNANFTFENCNVKNLKVNVNDQSADGCGVGGFVGQTQRGWEQPKMLNCHVENIDITAAGNVQIGGFMPWPGGHTIAENCTVTGKIDATGVSEAGYAGGFFGNLGWNCDLGHMGHEITDCVADVEIITKIAPAGGFVGTATNTNGNSMYATFKNCKALGNVTVAEGGTASVGGFAGVADRGYYENCVAGGTITGGESSVIGGFIGLIKHIDAAYDGRYPVGTRAYEVEQITIKSCVGVAGLDLIGKDDQSNKESLKRYHDVIVEQ